MSKKYASSTVANASIRNILSEISVALFDDVTEEYLKEAASYFGYKCPYTGDDIEYEIKNNIRTNLEMDHIIPINRKHLGLNARGNTIYVRKNANSCKGEKSYEEFLIKYGIDNKIPQEVIDDRIQKIKKFQEDYNYNHNLIYSNIKNEIQEIYDQVNKNQEKYTRQLISKINKSHAKVSTNDDLMDFRYFLEKQIGYGSAYSYVTALRKLLINEGITIKELEKKKGLIDLLIDKYKNDKEFYKEDHGKTINALRKFAEFKLIVITDRGKKNHKIVNKEYEFKYYLINVVKSISTQERYYKEVKKALKLYRLEFETITVSKLDDMIKDYSIGGINEMYDVGGFISASLSKFRDFITKL